MSTINENNRADANDIPDEILIRILVHLSPKMVKVCALVSKRWSSVIGASRELMNNFTLNVEDKSDFQLQRAKAIPRRFSSLKTLKLSRAFREIIFAHNLRHLTISNCRVSGLDLNECLERITNLESFTGKTVRIDEKTQLKRVRLTKLNELIVEHSDIDLLLAFDTDSLRVAHFAPYSEERGSAVLQILKQQRKLKNLTIGGYLANNFLSLNGACDFTLDFLEKFRIERSPVGAIAHERLIKFLSNHPSTIKSLELIFPANGPIYMHVINAMPTLTHLEIPVTELSGMSEGEFSQLVPCKNVKSVRFTGQFTSLARANAIFDLFPSANAVDLCDLTTSVHFMQTLLHLSRTRPRLEVLRIQNLFYDYNHEIFFFHLRELFVKKVHSEEHFCKFVKRHRKTLERVTIGLVDENVLKGVVIETIVECPNVNFISVASNTSLVMRKFKKLVASECEWTLAVKLRALTGMKIVELTFHFPQDRAVFEDKVLVHSEEMTREMNTLEDMGLNRYVNKYK